MSNVLTEMVNHNHDILIEDYLLNEMFIGKRAKAKKILKKANKEANKANKISKKLKDHEDSAKENHETLEGEFKNQVVASDDEHSTMLRDKMNRYLEKADEFADKRKELLGPKYDKIADKYIKSPKYRRKFVTKGKLSKLDDPELFKKIAEERATKRAWYESLTKEEKEIKETLAKDTKVENETKANKKQKVKTSGDLEAKLKRIRDSVK